MDVVSLRRLNRSQLQKLARENNIKANLKSETIITLLIERHPNGITSPVHKTPRSLRKSRKEASLGAKKLTPMAKNVVKATVILSRASRRPSVHDITNPNLGASSPPPPREDQSDIDAISDATSTYTFATPESSLEGTPEPPASPESLKLTVDMMAEIDAQDRVCYARTIRLRAAAAALLERAACLKAVIRAERAMRVRIEAYAAYWLRINRRWNYEESWSGMMKVTNTAEMYEVTTSDEESMSDAAIDEMADNRDHGVVATLQPQRFVAPHIVVPPAISENVTLESQPELAMSRENDANNDSALRPAKRPREDTESTNQAIAEDRYRPRRRLNSQRPDGVVGTSASPTRKPVDKGKGKMSAEEVEKMEREKTFSHAQYQEMQRSHHPVFVHSGLAEEEVDEHLAAAILADARENMRDSSHIPHLDPSATGGSATNSNTAIASSIPMHTSISTQSVRSRIVRRSKRSKRSKKVPIVRP